MSYRIKYKLCQCKECEITFHVPCKVINKMRKRPYCVRCGENIYVEELKDFWLQNPVDYRRPYTDEENEQIISAYKQGYTYKEIAESFEGRTWDGIRKNIWRLKQRGMFK